MAYQSGTITNDGQETLYSISPCPLSDSLPATLATNIEQQTLDLYYTAVNPVGNRIDTTKSHISHQHKV
jgi:hypothetical protein